MSKFEYYLADENRLIDKRMEELSKMEPMQTFDEMLEECGIWLGPSWLYHIDDTLNTERW